ncbi:MAG: hypothetical protein ACLUUG_07800 [Lachnospiraceae bacterium]
MLQTTDGLDRMHPSTATEEWGKEMLETTANYIVDFMEEFKKVNFHKAMPEWIRTTLKLIAEF